MSNACVEQAKVFTACLLVLMAAATGQTSGVASDVRYLKCAACQHLVEAAHASLARERQQGASLSEDDVAAIIDRSCKPDTKEGAWLSKIDLVERDGKLLLVEQAQPGPCEQECMTIAMACDAVVEGMENELSEALWEGSASKQETSSRACSSWSTACRKPAPKLDAARPHGPLFRALTDEEQALRDQRERGGLAAPGELSVGALRTRLDVRAPLRVRGDGDDDDSAQRDHLGRGESVGALEHSVAFEEL